MKLDLTGAPCDCIGEDGYIDCDCRNSGNLIKAVHWVSEQGFKNRITDLEQQLTEQVSTDLLIDLCLFIQDTGDLNKSDTKLLGKVEYILKLREETK